MIAILTCCLMLLLTFLRIFLSAVDVADVDDIVSVKRIFVTMLPSRFLLLSLLMMAPVVVF
jgi:hypothetical protein